MQASIEQRFLTEVRHLQCTCGEAAASQLLTVMQCLQAEARVSAELRHRIVATLCDANLENPVM